MLHQAHVQYISWQTLDIFTNKKTSISRTDSVHLLLTNRSGYCFHLNHAFYLLLRTLGYNVTIHSAGIHSKNKVANIDGFHVGLIVHFEEGINYLVDVGLGDMPLKPILLEEGFVQQGFSTLNLTQSTVSPDAIRLNNDPRASYLGVDYSLKEEADFQIFYPKHEMYRDSEKSLWRNLLIFKNRTETQANELKGCVFTTRDDFGVHQEEITSKKMWLELIHDVFYEQLCAYNHDEINTIWLKVQNEQLKWERKIIQ